MREYKGFRKGNYLSIAQVCALLNPRIGDVIAYLGLHGTRKGDSLWLTKLLSLLSVVAIDAIVYVGVLLLLKEKLVSSFLPSSRARREKENAESESEGK